MFCGRRTTKVDPSFLIEGESEPARGRRLIADLYAALGAVGDDRRREEIGVSGAEQVGAAEFGRLKHIRSFGSRIGAL